MPPAPPANSSPSWYTKPASGWPTRPKYRWGRRGTLWVRLPTNLPPSTAPTPKMDNFWTGALFFQDDFHILPRLTLNLGMRYELQQPPTDPFNRESTFVPGVQSQVLKGSQVPTGLLVPGDPGVGRGIVSMKWNHVSPRLGLAWDPAGNGKTS